MDTEITRKVFGWKGLNTLCYITEGGKATLDLRRSFFLKTKLLLCNSCWNFFFCVNIELAQYASVHKRTLEIKNSGVVFFLFFFPQRSTLPLHWSDRGHNLSAWKHTFSQSTFTLTPAHRYWIKPCSKGKTGRWINPVLLDLIHGYAEWMLRQPITGQLAWLAWCGTSYRGSCHPMGSIHFHPPLWTEGEHSPTGQTWKGILAMKINTPNLYFRVELKQ